MPPKKPQGQAPREDPQQHVLRKNFKRAIELYRVLVKEAPNDANQGLRLADCLVLDGQTAAAVEEYKRVAGLYAEQGFLLKAIGVNKKVVKLDPAQEGVHQNLSKLYEERGLLASPGGGPVSAIPGDASASGSSRGGTIQFDMEEASQQGGMDLDLGLGGGARGASSPSSFETIDQASVDALEPPEDLAPDSVPGAMNAEAELAALDELDAATLEADSDLAAGDPSAESLAPDYVPSASFEFGSTPDASPAPAASASGLGLDWGAAPASAGPSGGHAQEPRTGAAGATTAGELSVDDLGDALAELPEEHAPAAARSSFAADESNPLGSGDASDASPDAFRRTPLFSDFTASEFVEVVRKMGQETFPKGTIIVREGDPGDALFVLVTGSVRVVTKAKGRELVLAELHEGDFFGEGSLITGKPRTATIIASEDSELLSLSRTSLDEIAAIHPRVREVMKQFYQQRAENTVKAILGSKK